MLHLVWFFSERRRLEDVMANFNDSLVTKMEEESSSQSLEAILSSGQVDTRTGLLNALVIIRFNCSAKSAFMTTL